MSDKAQVGQTQEETLDAEKKSTLRAWLTQRLMNAIDEADEEAALLRVDDLRDRYPDASSADLVEILIRQKCLKSGTIGAATSGISIIPFIGTLTAITLGTAADIGWTFILQVELVLEIAAVHGRCLNDQEKRTVVTTVTGISAGANSLISRASTQMIERMTEEMLERTVFKGIPVVGAVVTAGTNMIMTYVVGQRADAYFKLGPKEVGDWNESVRAITGVDRQKIIAWLTEVRQTSSNFINDQTWRIRHTVLIVSQQVRQVIEYQRGESLGDRIRK